MQAEQQEVAASPASDVDKENNAPHSASGQSQAARLQAAARRHAAEPDATAGVVWRREITEDDLKAGEELWHHLRADVAGCQQRCDKRLVTGDAPLGSSSVGAHSLEKQEAIGDDSAAVAGMKRKRELAVSGVSKLPL